MFLLCVITRNEQIKKIKEEKFSFMFMLTLAEWDPGNGAELNRGVLGIL